MAETREFEPGEIAQAVSFIESLPGECTRIYVDVQDEYGEWACIYGDDRCHVATKLAAFTRGRPFRLRGTEHVRRM